MLGRKPGLATDGVTCVNKSEGTKHRSKTVVYSTDIVSKKYVYTLTYA